MNCVINIVWVNRPRFPLYESSRLLCASVLFVTWNLFGEKTWEINLVLCVSVNVKSRSFFHSRVLTIEQNNFCLRSFTFRWLSMVKNAMTFFWWITFQRGINNFYFAIFFYWRRIQLFFWEMYNHLVIQLVEIWKRVRGTGDCRVYSSHFSPSLHLKCCLFTITSMPSFPYDLFSPPGD